MQKKTGLVLHPLELSVYQPKKLPSFEKKMYIYVYTFFSVEDRNTQSACWLSYGLGDQSVGV
jgi:hypothetical protein